MFAVWLPGSDAFGLTIAVALLLGTILLLRLRRQTQAERGARQRAERRAAFAENLQQLVAVLSRAKVPAGVIEGCIPEFLHAVEAAAGALVLVREGGRTGEIARLVGVEDVSTRSRFPLSAYPSLAHVAGRIVIAAFEAPVSSTPGGGRVAALDRLAAYRTAVAVPLVTAGRAVGIIVLALEDGRNLDADERDLLMIAGRRTAEALARAEAYESAERARLDAEAFRARADVELRERHRAEAALRESETKYRALAARTNRLYGLSAALSESITVEAVAKAIVRHGKVAIGASAGSVALLSEGRRWFDTLYGDDYAERPPDSGGGFAAEDGMCATAAVDTRRPVFVTSFSECQQRYWRSASIAADGGFASAAVLPLVVEDRAIGFLAFHFTAPVHFDDEYRALLESVAQHCAQAIDRARLYETAQRARAEAERANRSKDDFLSTVSHELRTPLTAVLGWASMLRSGSLDAPRTTRAVEAIFNNATRQAQMIDELLDISRIVGGRVAFEAHEIDIDETIRGSIEAVMPQAGAKGVEIRLGAHASVAVNADPRRLDQVFLNLLANAIKFTSPGGCVTVDVVPRGQTVEVRIADNGMGIDPGFLEHMFERFRQGDNSTARRKGGLGLGLFIARELLEAQSGSIRAESAGLGQGATFIVTLPVVSGRPAAVEAAAPQPAASAEESSQRLSGVRVLIVDDEPDVRELMAAALEHSGATVTSVGSAADALAVLTRDEVDVLLADIAMPGQDGYELIKATRTLPSVRARTIPAAAVTACARDDERERALAAGFQRHLAKPVRPETLVQTVATLAATTAAGAALWRRARSEPTGLRPQ
jgi:signal transduction histidine kinase/ActR/RegA family two-component response regulator